MSKKNLPLSKVVKRYEESRELSEVYVRDLGCTIRRFERHLQEPAKTNHLAHRVVNRWIKDERDTGKLSPRTRWNSRTNIITIWKFADTQKWPVEKCKVKKIRDVQLVRKNPQAWKLEELLAVATAARTLQGVLPTGVPTALYFEALIWFAFDTGLRRSDLWNFDMSVLENRSAALTQHKTKNVHVIQVAEYTHELMLKIQAILIGAGVENPNQVFKWPKSQSTFYQCFRKIRKAAGIDWQTVNRCLHHIRRTGATAVDIEGLNASDYLGHSTPGLAQKCYVDQSQARKPITPSRPVILRADFGYAVPADTDRKAA